MTEEITNLSSADQSQPVQPEVNDVTSEAPAQIETPVAPPAEKMIPQSQVNSIAAREAKKAAEKARHETIAEYERQRGLQQNAPQPPQNGGSMGGMQQANPEQIRQMIKREAWEMSHQAAADQMLQTFNQKVDAVKEKYPDFEDKYAALNIDRHPEFVLWTNGMDNVGDVLYDLASNPAKVANVLMLANAGFPQLAQQEFNKLSASIKQNEDAKKQAQQSQIPAPLDQVKTSPIAVDNGNMSVTDFRKMFRG